MVSVTVRIRGQVQGVGFRYWLRQEARRAGVDGWVRNISNGTVEAFFAGNPEPVDAIVAKCRIGPAGANVIGVDINKAEDEPGSGFRIRRRAT